VSSLRADGVRLTARAVVSRPRNTRWIRLLARIGLVAKGVSYAIVGILALELAFGAGGKATSRTGALATLVQDAYGKALLIGLAAGFAAYAAWRLAQAFFEADEAKGAKKWAKRAAYIGRAAIYAGLTYSAIKVLTGTHEESQTGKAHKATAHVLSWPAGRWLVAGAGAFIIAVGLWNGYRALSCNFREKWNRSKMSEMELTWGTRVGVAGMLARMVVFSLIGIFLIKAALDYDPKDAIGLDGALQKLAGQSYGEWLLGLTGAGFLAYALFCFVDARYRRV